MQPYLTFSAADVRAILRRGKCQTRRLIDLGGAMNPRRERARILATPRHAERGGRGVHLQAGNETFMSYCNVAVGDLLWVKEPFVVRYGGIVYLADYPGICHATPARLMKKEQARLYIRVTDVCAQHLQDIDEEGLLAELGDRAQTAFPLRQLFAMNWNIANRVNRWADNPPVWVITFAKEHL